MLRPVSWQCRSTFAVSIYKLKCVAYSQSTLCARSKERALQWWLLGGNECLSPGLAVGGLFLGLAKFLEVSRWFLLVLCITLITDLSDLQERSKQLVLLDGLQGAMINSDTCDFSPSSKKLYF